MDWLEPDPPTWRWPFPCHRHGHIYEVGDARCIECGLPYELSG